MAKKKTIKQTLNAGIKARVKEHPEWKPQAKKIKKAVKKADRRIGLIWVPIAYFLYRFTFEESFGTLVENQISNVKKRVKTS